MTLNTVLMDEFRELETILKTVKVKMIVLLLDADALNSWDSTDGVDGNPASCSRNIHSCMPNSKELPA
jgi:hypothetical protein